MAEQRMKVRDKKVQKMTKDGLVEENLTDKSSVRVSNRASDVQMGIKQGEKKVSLVDKYSRQSERSGKNIRPSVQKSRDAPELMRTENQSEDFGQNRKQQNRKRIRAEIGKESRLAEKSEYLRRISWIVRSASNKILPWSASWKARGLILSFRVFGIRLWD